MVTYQSYDLLDFFAKIMAQGHVNGSLRSTFVSMWHKAEWTGHPMRLELVKVYQSSLLTIIPLEVPLNLLSTLLWCGTRPNERGTQWDSNSWKFASQAC